VIRRGKNNESGKARTSHGEEAGASGGYAEQHTTEDEGGEVEMIG